MVKFKVLAQFTVDDFPYVLVSIFILFLSQLTTFAYYVIDRFISITTKSTSAILLCHVYFCFDIVLMVLFSAAIGRDSISVLRLPFFSPVLVFSCEVSLVCRLKYPYSCFSSHFYFLIIFVPLMLLLFVLFLVAVISLLHHF